MVAPHLLHADDPMSTAPKKAPAGRPVARFRLRVTAGETIFVGPGKISLLEAIRDTRSITAAAKSMGMSYRRAWVLVDELNGSLAGPAVAASIGGQRGGGSMLTALGDELVDVYRRIEATATRACAGDLARLLELATKLAGANRAPASASRRRSRSRP
jgi:molybdate transport system regulatory protein